MDDRLLKLKSPYLAQSFLLDRYRDYLKPQDKLKNLVKKGDLVRIRRELYIPGPDYPYSISKETLANLVYGPSAISLEWALSFYGMIPERVETITSICFKRNKKFSTPLGVFTYRYLARELFPIGLTWEQSKSASFLIATPEKALCDLAYHEKIASREEAESYLLEHLRIDPDSLHELNPDNLFQVASAYGRASVTHVADAIQLLRGRKA